MAVGLGLEPGWFHQHLTADPLILFRIFRYPPEAGLADPNWGVAEHTDYGLLTMLRQDASGGLQVHAPSGWIDAPPIPGTFVCNLGDMLERMTGGRYRSTPHRVRNPGDGDRLSFPFFFDPAWDAEVLPVPGLGDQPAPGARPVGRRGRRRLDRHLRRLPLDQGRPRLPRPPQTTSVQATSAWRTEPHRRRGQLTPPRARSAWRR